MQLRLNGLRQLDLCDENASPMIPGYKRLDVLYCAICRSDAKMWIEGHRDLIFPRVPGHEIVAADAEGRRYVIWPGTVCGSCKFCRSGNENLCEEMQIIGFHLDGGFSENIDVLEQNMLLVPEKISSIAACFAEPVGCVLHILEKLNLEVGAKIIVYGAGTMGLIAAMICNSRGIRPVLIEKNQEKIGRVQPFLDTYGISCLKDTTESGFDGALNACPDPIAFNLGIAKLAKGGKMGFFSGLKKNASLESNLVNLVHYRENEIYGAYGLTRRDMENALLTIADNISAFGMLVEDIIPPQHAAAVLEDVLLGKGLKYIIDFAGDRVNKRLITSHPMRDKDHGIMEGDRMIDLKNDYKTNLINSVIADIRRVENTLEASAQHKLDNKTKPLGSLGKLEALALRMSLIQDTLDPKINKKSLFVFAADHGVAEEGVSAFPAEVTCQMVENFLKGGAAINVLSRYHGIDLHVVDMGVNADFEEHPALIHKKIRKGTRNFALTDAMTEQEAIAAIESGMDVFFEQYKKRPIDILGLGEMGIANTTSASAIISVITGLPVAEATGRGTGVDDSGLQRKTEVIEKALNFHNLPKTDGLLILRKIGGLEIGGIAGAVMAAASKRTAVVLDGVISTAAGLIACLICPNVKGYLFSGHRSVEPSHNRALAHLGIEPVIDFQMRLGEGTGSAMTIDIIDSACHIMREMASFDDAGVSGQL